MVVGDEGAVCPAEGDILDPDGDGVGFGVAGFGVLSNPEEVVESDVDEVGCCLLPGTEVGALPGLIQQVCGEADWNGQLWGRFGVVARVAPEHVPEGGPVGAVGSYLVGGVGLEVQFEGLADGA